MKHARLLACSILIALCPWAGPSPRAALVRAITLEQSVDLSDAIVVGEVVGRHAVRAEGAILTLVRIRVIETLKGDLPVGRVAVIAAYGGEVDGARMVTPGEAEFGDGEVVLLQLETIAGRWHSLGMALGKWRVTRDRSGEAVIERDLSGLDFAGDEEVARGPLTLERFRDLVLRRSGGR